MDLRMVEIVLGQDVAGFFTEPLDDIQVWGLWRVKLANDTQLIRVLVASEQAEKLLDLCAERYGELKEFRCVVLQVGATLPRIEEPEDEEQARESEEQAFKGKRISREELYADLEGNVEITANYLALIALSTIVAAIGLMKENVAVIIGAMVIAPLLASSMALALATLLADWSLARRTIKSMVIGVFESLVLACLLGLLLQVDPNTAELVSRTEVGLGDAGLALCAGAAGALSFTGGTSSALVGVMVAVALLPPLTTCGLYLSLGHGQGVIGAALLFVTNLVCINLSGVIVFRLQGIKPGGREQSRSAVLTTTLALTMWTVLLALLSWFIFRRGGIGL